MALEREPPANVLAEYALLGAILSNNKAYDQCAGLNHEHFSDPNNQRVYQLIQQSVAAGSQADAITLSSHIDPAYLNQLVSCMVGISNAGDYARVIRDCALRRALIPLAENLIERLYGGDDPTTVMAEASANIDVVTSSLGAAAGVSFLDAVTAALGKAEAAHRGEAGATGLMTGIASLDARWGGLHPGALDIIGARSGTGKTAFASQIARLIAGQGVPVAFFSMEVPAADLAMANLTSETGISVDDLRAGRITGRGLDLIKAKAWLDALPITVMDSPNVTLSGAVSEMRALKRRGVRLFIFDHRNKFGRDPGTERMPRLEWYGHVTDRLKNAAKLLEVPIVLLVQLNRQMIGRDDPRPRISDLEYAGEQDADNIALIHRPALDTAPQPQQGKMSAEAQANQLARWYAERAAVANDADVIFAKRRFGEPGIVKLRFSGQTLTFSES